MRPNDATCFNQTLPDETVEDVEDEDEPDVFGAFCYTDQDWEVLSFRRVLVFLCVPIAVVVILIIIFFRNCGCSGDGFYGEKASVKTEGYRARHIDV